MKKVNWILKVRSLIVVTLCLSLALVSSPAQSARADEVTYEEDGAIGLRKATVTFEVESFTVKLPKTITSNASITSYDVGVKGVLPEGYSLYIQPAESFVLTSSNGVTTVATVVQDKITWLPSEISADEYDSNTGTITASLSTGTYTGTLQFDVGVRIPGLYASDGSFTPWEQLVSDGTVTMEGAVFSGINADASGDLVLPATVGSIGKSACRYNTGLTSLYIPRGITSIQWYAFNDRPDLTLIYDEVTYTYSERNTFKAVASANGVVFSTEWWSC